MIQIEIWDNIGHIATEYYSNIEDVIELIKISESHLNRYYKIRFV